MAVVQSLGALASVETGWSLAYSFSAMKLYDGYFADYATMYRTQPNVRVCVDFLARNIAQLGLHVFRRVDETDRVREREHPLARLLVKPNSFTTRYRLIESLIADLGIYFRAYWWKLRGENGMALLRVPPQFVTVTGSLVPTAYEINLGTERYTPAANEIVHFRGYNPGSAVEGLSPMETLRRVLAEEHAMGDYRENFWANSARMNGIIERPKDAPKWGETARERFKAELEALYSGSANSGKTAILEEGMTWRQVAFDAEQSEYLGGRKLTREECARSYHIPLPMVGILDHATFSNIKEQHKNLYQDCLGPWLAMIEDEIGLQLLSEWGDVGDLYVEFNIQEKLQGSFEEQTLALQAAVGRPWMTANEARARLNLPTLEDGDELVTPMNVTVGGQASPRDSAPVAIPGESGESADKALVPGHVCAHGVKAAGEVDATLPKVRARHETKWMEVLGSYFRRQGKTIRSRVPGSGSAPLIDQVWHDGQRWDRELAGDLYRLNVATATVWAEYVAGELEAELTPELMYDWLSENARRSATEINGATRAAVEAALGEPEYGDVIGGAFESAATVRAPEIAVSKVTNASNFGAHEAAKQGRAGRKVWAVNSPNPRPVHAAMHGETVGIREPFSNGQMWPGDPDGGADNCAGCTCSVSFGR